MEYWHLFKKAIEIAVSYITYIFKYQLSLAALNI